MSRPQIVRLGDLLVQQNLLTEEQLAAALQEQRKHGRKLGRVLVENGIVTEDQISEALARQLKIPHIKLKEFAVNMATARRLPEAQARRFRAVALEDRGHAMLVGMVDPSDLFAYDEVAKLLKCELELAVVGEEQLLNVIDRVYRKTDEISGLAKELEQEVGANVVDFGALAVSPTSEDAPVVKLLQSVFEDAVQVRASDIHIEPQERTLLIRFRIDGVLHIQTEADIKIASAVVVRLKLMSGLDISEKRLPQDGRFNVKLQSQQVDVRISTVRTQYGESIVMRLLNQKGVVLDLDRIGMPPDILDSFRRMIHRPNGLVLVTGPTGSGKTTTLYAALAELNSPEVKILTVEDPVEYRLSGINQVQVLEKIDLTFSRALRSFLRQDPDVILVGEMRDSETAQIGLRAAMTGHLVLSTLHTNSAASTPIRLLDMGVPGYMLASSLLAVMAQRLVRTICEGCSDAYQPKVNEQEFLALELGDQVLDHRYWQGRGCSRCNGTGYQGRLGVYELLEVTQTVAAGMHNFDPGEFGRIAQAQMVGKTLRSQAVKLVLAGKTTISEAMRISNQQDE